MYQRDVQEIKAILTAQGGDEAIKGDLKIQKAVELLVGESKTVASAE